MSNEKTYRYDVFISYRWVDPDKAWVRNELKTALENAGLEVCLDVDDFVPGRDLIGEMERASTESRRGICVLSPDYFSGSDRPVDFESRMLRSLDFSGNSSRLIPFILRQSELPLYIRNLVPVDWTDPSSHQREWSKLLDLLEAKNRDAPPPGPLQIDPNKPLPPKPPVRPPGIRIPKSVWLGLVAIVFFGLLAIGFKTCRKPKVRDVEGHVYYERVAGNSALTPVEGVEVYLSDMPAVRSPRTGADGKFTLTGVPATGSINLKANYGSVDYSMGEYKPGVAYEIIPRDPDHTANRRFIATPWIEAPNEPCIPDANREVRNFKVYKIDIGFQSEAGKQEAVLTTELLDAPEMIILSAHVLATPRDSYRNETRPNEDRAKSHTWLFKLAKSGMRTQLVVCLGSANSVIDLSGAGTKLSTYYNLQ